MRCEECHGSQLDEAQQGSVGGGSHELVHGLGEDPGLEGLRELRDAQDLEGFQQTPSFEKLRGSEI